jgi:type I pantothenate kinase
MDAGQSSLHPSVCLSRKDWARLPVDNLLALSEDDVREIGAHLSQEEATQVYLPLSRLLHLHVRATQSPP